MAAILVLGTCSRDEPTALTEGASLAVAAATPTHTLLAAGNNAANQKVYTTASIAPAANALVTVAVVGHVANTVSPSPVLTGGGMTTWTVVASATFDPIASPSRRVTIYRAMRASPGSGPLTITFSGTQRNAQWIVSQWTGVDQSGANGAGAIVQSGTARANAVTGLMVPLAPFGNANNVAYGAFGVTRNAAVVTPGAGFTEIAEQPSGESTPGDLQAEWGVNDNTIDATWGTLSLNAAAVGVEIKSVPPAVDAGQSSVAASPTSITAGETATITVTARDANGNPIAGATVVLAATGIGYTLTHPASPTNASGIATGTLTATSAGDKVVSATVTVDGVTTAIFQTATVTVTPGPAARVVFLVQPTSVTAGTTMAPPVQVEIRDQFANRVTTATNGVALAIGTNPAGGTLTGGGSVAAVNGVATFAGLRIDKAATGYTLAASSTGLTGAASAAFNVTAGSVSAAQSTVTAAPATITASSGTSSSTITVTARDASGNPIAGATVALTASGTGNTLTPTATTNASGVATGTLSSTVAEDKTVTATVTVGGVTTAISQAATVTVTPAGVNAAQSTLSAAPGSITASSGGSAAAITVTVRDQFGNAIQGATVTLLASGTGNTLTPTATTNASGVATGTLSSTVAEAKTVSATVTVGGVTTAISQTATVTVTPGAAAQLVFVVQPSNVTAGATMAPPVQIEIRDQFTNRVTTATNSVALAIGTNPAGGTLTGGGSVAAVGGVATFAGLRIDKAAAGYTLAASSTGLTGAASAAFNVTVGSVSAAQSTVAAAPATITASSGTSSSTITVTARDASGNPIAGATVALTASGTGNTLTPTATTNASGVATGTLSSTAAGDKIVSATINGTGVTQTVTVTVTHGAAAQLAFVVQPSNVTAGATMAPPVQVEIRDQFTNRVTTATNSVGLAIGTNPASATLTGGGAVAAVNGRATFPGLSLDKAGTGYTLQASSGALTTATSSAFNVTASAVSAAQSTVTAAPATITASSGTSSSTITVTARDASGNPIAGATVALTASGTGNTLTPTATTNASGVATGTLSSTAAGDKIVSATINGTGVTQTVTVTVTHGAAAQLAFVVQPSNVTAGATMAPPVQVEIRDQFANRVTTATNGVALAIGTNPAGGTLTGGGSVAAVNGVATFAGLRIDKAATGYTLAASSTGLTGAASAAFNVTAGSVSAAQSTVTAAPATITASSGTSSSTITVTARDASGNPIAGATVALTASGTGNTLTPTATTNASGVATGTLSSTAAGDKIVSATINGTGVTQTVTVTVTHGAAAQLAFVVQPSNVTAGATMAPPVQVEIRDQFTNRVTTATNSVGLAIGTNPAGGTLTGGGSVAAVNGVATFAGLRIDKAATGYTLAASSTGLSGAASAAFNVTVGSVSAAQSTVAAAPGSIPAGSGGSTITVTARDASGNPIAGATVALTASGTGNTLTPPAGTTNASGVATGTLSSTVAEAKTVSATVTVGGVTTAILQTATVTVTPQGTSEISQMVLTAGSNTVNEKVSTTASISPAANALVTVAVMGINANGVSPSPVLTGGGMTTWTEVVSATFDAIGTPERRVTIYRAMSAAPSSGPLTITFSGTQGNAQWIVSQWSGVDQSGENGAGAIVQSGTAQGDAVMGLTVQLGPFANANNVAYGAFGVKHNAAVVTPGAGFTEIAEQPSGESTPGDLQVEWRTNDNTIDATWGTLSLNAAAVGVEITAAASGPPPPVVDAGQSSVAASPTSIAAGGTATITVTARDASGMPVSGASVELFATGSGNTLTQPAGTTNASGIATGTLRSTATGSKVVSATINGTGVTQTATVTVTHGAAAQLAFVVQPSNVTAGATMAPAVQVEIRDQFTNRVTTATNSVGLAIGTNPAGGTLTGGGSVAAVNGVATFAGLRIDKAATGYTLAVSSTGLTGAGSTSFNVAVGSVSAAQSTVTAAPATITASSGASSSTITVTARDASGNPIAGATVALTASGTGNTLTPPAGTTNASGVATGTLSSTVAEDKTVPATVTVGGVTTAISQAATVTVTPQAIAGISHTLLTTGADAVNQRVYTTASIAPAPNTLVLVAVLGRNPAGASPSPTLSGGGMTSWTELATVTFDPISGPTRRLTIYRAMSATPGSGPLTITFTASQGNAQWSVSQWDGTEISGVNGAGAIVQTGAARGDAVSGLTVPLAAFGHGNNAAYGAFGVASNAPVVTPGAAFTEISEEPSGESTPGDLQTEWATNRNLIDASWTALNGAALGVEIKAANTGPVVQVASVEVTPASATIDETQTVQLTAILRDASGNVVSGRVVTWTSTSTATATVSVGGLVTGKAAGSATITATHEGLSGTSAITVVRAPVASVSVAPASATVHVGFTVSLIATPKDASGAALAGRTITWVSGNTAIATVNGSGVVSGVAEGVVTITAASEGRSGNSAVTVLASPPPGSGVVLVGAGDIAGSGTGDEETALLLDNIPGTVFTAGDNAYPNGTATEFATYYEPTWGRHKARTRPTPGNHEYNTPGATGYYGYFGASAGPAGQGYYSYDLGDWHIISLNSNISMSAGSVQEQWLRADLAASTKQCVLAMWHHPRFSSGSHGSSTASQPLWQALYDFDAEVIIVGHDHNYQRFAPQTAAGAADPVRGLRQFVAGMGGRGHYSFGTPIANTEAYNTDTFGVLKMTLYADWYAWEFVPVAGKTYTDSGSGSCH